MAPSCAAVCWCSLWLRETPFAGPLQTGRRYEHERTRGQFRCFRGRWTGDTLGLLLCPHHGAGLCDCLYAVPPAQAGSARHNQVPKHRHSLGGNSRSVQSHAKIVTFASKTQQRVTLFFASCPHFLYVFWGLWVWGRGLICGNYSKIDITLLALFLWPIVTSLAMAGNSRDVDCTTYVLFGQIMASTTTLGSLCNVCRVNGVPGYPHVPESFVRIPLSADRKGAHHS
eukprot:1374957-Amorphochlora_amoeboformis.AAC.1